MKTLLNRKHLQTKLNKSFLGNFPGKIFLIFSLAIGTVFLNTTQAQTNLSDLRYPAYHEFSERLGVKDYNILKTYLPGQLISRLGGIYKNIVEITTGESFSETKWKEIANKIFANDTAGNLIKLWKKSDNTDRDAGTDFAITDSGNVGIGTTTPDPSAILDLNSTTKGFVSTRMTTAERDAISSPVEGLQVYNTTEKTQQFFNGTDWINLGLADGSEIAFMVVKTVDQDLVAGDVLAWDSSELNKGDGFDLSSNVFTAPQDGIYYFHADILGQEDSEDGSYRIWKNDANTKYASFAGYDMNGSRQSVMSAVMDLRIGDKIDIRTVGEDAADGSEDDFYTKFSGFKINSGFRINPGGHVENRTFVYSDSDDKTFDSGDAKVLMTTPEWTIQSGKDVKLYMNIPTRHDGKEWGGLYINANIQVNGIWYNLGNNGHSGGVMNFETNSISEYINMKILKLTSELSLTGSYTIKVELTAKAYAGKVLVNKNHSMNRISAELGSRGELQTWGSSQNYATIIVTEIDS